MTLIFSSKLLVVGVLMFLLGLATIIFEPYEYFFNKTTIFQPDGMSYGFWHRSDVHLFLHAYFFNITNKAAFLAGKEKLRFQEVGPYVYRENAIHHNMTFNHETGTVSSSPRYTLHWVPELNKGKESDVLIVPNVAMLLAVSKYSYLKLALNAFILQTKSSPIVELTVREYLFGYDSAFIHAGNTIFPFWINFEKIGMLDRLYDHEEDVATTFTGELVRSNAGQFHTYNDYSDLQNWESPCSNLVNSSDGKKFGNNLKADDTLMLYRKGLCRPIMLKPINDEIVNKFGIPTYFYKLEENVFDNGEFNERNKCFCKSTPCLPNTIQDISECFYGFPVALSFPHFFNGSDSLREPFEDLNPDAERHDTYAYINPQIGYLVQGSAKLQINAVLNDLSGIRGGADQFSNMILPLMWAELAFDSDLKFRILLFLVVKLLPVLETILALFLIFCGISLTIYQIRKLMRRKYSFNWMEHQAKIEIH